MKNILRNDIEYIIHSDEKGNIIWPISKNHAHIKWVRENLTHYSTWSMIYNPKIWKYGIQLKNPKMHDKYTWWKWDMWVAWHNCYIKENWEFKPLNFEENLVKEAKEEIWINIEICKTKQEFLKFIKGKPEKTLWFIFEEFLFKTKRNNEWVGLAFVIVPDIKVKFEDGEVIDFKRLSPDKIESFIETTDNYFSGFP